MTAAIAHRGPDASGEWAGEEGGIGFRRLSIIDLSAQGNQPFTNDAGDLVAVVNGEIYNFAGLRKELEGRGHRFRSRSDCEVALHGYAEYGDGFVDRLDGMFAVAVLDRRRKRLVLARDRLGIKPLYMAVSAAGIRFGSEMGAILADRSVPRRIDALALNLYFAKEVVPAPRTIFEGIGKLLPGEVVTAELERGEAGVARRRYWAPEYGAMEGRSEQSIAEELRERVRAAVRSHLVSDVPVGVLLSGGLDSTSVLAEVREAAGEGVKGFTIELDDAENDESAVARRLAREWGVEHHEEALRREEVEGVLDAAAPHFGEPFGDTSSVPTYAVSRLAARHVKTVLSGDGGDELFSGYITAAGARRLHWGGLTPQALRAGPAGLLGALRPSASLRRLRLPMWLMMASLRDHIFDPATRGVLRHEWRRGEDEILETYDHLRERLEALPPVDAYFAGLVAQYLQDDILTKVDRASAAHGLEVRVPLLDRQLVEFATRIPWRLRFRRDTPKYIFREAVRAKLPGYILSHPKRGFGMGRAYQQEGRWQARIDELRERTGLIDRLIDFRGREKWDGRLTWRVLFLASWAAGFAEREGVTCG